MTTLSVSRQEIAHRFPWFLPDSNHFLYLVISADPQRTGIYVASLADPNTATFVVRTGYDAAYASGYLLFVREQTLMAQPFDLRRFQLVGDAAPLVEQIDTNPPTGRSGFSVSENGVLVARIGAFMTQLSWLDRSGKPLETVGSPDVYRNPALSPDGRRVIVERSDPQSSSSDLWVRDLTRGTFSRFTFDPADDTAPVWSPDGRRVVFYSIRQPHGLYVKDANGGGEELILQTDLLYSEDWSSDGQWLVYEAAGPQGALGLWTLPLAGERKPVLFLQTKFSQIHAQLSPNGKWIAYASNESGRTEVYVQRFPDRGGKAQISTAGGSQPRWRRDGRELFYISGAARLMAVVVKTDAAFEASVPTELFPLRLPTIPTNSRNNYVVSADGQRILVNYRADQDSNSLVVTLNWTEALKR